MAPSPARSTGTSTRPRADLEALCEVGIDMRDVSRQLETEGVAAFSKSYDELLQALEDKANDHRARFGS